MHTTNIQRKPQVNKIPEGVYSIDSFRLAVDRAVFTEVNLEDKYWIISQTTGEIVNETKERGKQVLLNGHKVNILGYKKTLRGIQYDKVEIYFSSNVNGSRYFEGISKETVYEVLLLLQKENIVNFKCVNTVYRAFTAKDVDIKRDYLFNKKDKEKIHNHYKRLKSDFNGYPENCKVYNGQYKGLGLQANFRDNSSYTKPFIKFYDKYTELFQKHPEIYDCLHPEIQAQLRDNFVSRFEYTIKNNQYCKKLGIGNSLHEIHDLPQEKLGEIAKYVYEVNFKSMHKKRVHVSKMRFSDKLLASYMFEDIQKRGMSAYEVKMKYIREADSENRHTNRAIAKFEKIYDYITGEGAEKTQENVEFTVKWNSFLGFY